MALATSGSRARFGLITSNCQVCQSGCSRKVAVAEPLHMPPLRETFPPAAKSRRQSAGDSGDDLIRRGSSSPALAPLAGSAAHALAKVRADMPELLHLEPRPPTWQGPSRRIPQSGSVPSIPTQPLPASPLFDTGLSKNPLRRHSSSKSTAFEDIDLRSSSEESSPSQSLPRDEWSPTNRLLRDREDMSPGGSMSPTQSLPLPKARVLRKQYNAARRGSLEMPQVQTQLLRSQLRMKVQTQLQRSQLRTKDQVVGGGDKPVAFFSRAKRNKRANMPALQKHLKPLNLEGQSSLKPVVEFEEKGYASMNLPSSAHADASHRDGDEAEGKAVGSQLSLPKRWNAGRASESPVSMFTRANGLLFANEDASRRERMKVAFRRFQDATSSEVPREYLHDLLMHLGFLTSSREKTEKLAAETSQFALMDFQDFCDFVEQFAKRESTEVREKAAAWAATMNACSLREVQAFLRSLGCIARGCAITEAAAMCGVNLEGAHLSPEDLQALLHGLQASEGFTMAELEQAVEAFEELEQSPPGTRAAYYGPVKASQIRDGLTAVLGAYTVERAASVLQTPALNEEAPGLNVTEFLVWGRRVRDRFLQEACDAFVEADTAGEGQVSLEKLPPLARKMGFTLLSEGTKEVMARAGLAYGEPLDFDAFERFITECHQSHGFTDKERENLLALYARFDYDGNCELEHLEVLDLMRYMGYATKLDEVQHFIKSVDYNDNGTLDKEEFLRLMRYQREEAMTDILKNYYRVCGSQKMLPKQRLTDALAVLGFNPREEVLEELQEAEGSPEFFSMESFTRVADNCRERVNVDSRQRAGFGSEDFDRLSEYFEHYATGSPSNGVVSVVRLMELMSESNMQINTSKGRMAMLQALDAARKAALEADLPGEEVSELGGSNVCFWDFLHLVRSLVRDKEAACLDRETRALEETNFSSEEVVEFRRNFAVMATEYKEARLKEKNSDLIRFGQLIDELLALPTISTQAFVQMLQSFGVRCTAAQRSQLDMKFKQHAADPEEEGILDFAAFMRVWRWMLDRDFAKIGSAMASPGRGAGDR